MRGGARDERLAFTALLARAGTRRRMLRVAGDEARDRLGAAGMAVFVRDRRRGSWTRLAADGPHGGAGDAALFTDPASRDPKDAVRRLARPFRPHGRLAGGIVLYREEPPFDRREASRLSRFARLVTAELLRRDDAAARSAAARLVRKLAARVRPIDVVYHGLDAAARLTRADHTATLHAPSPGGAARVVAEKWVVPPRRSPRVGKPGAADDPVPGLPPAAHVLAAALDEAGPRAATLVVRALGGDPFDEGDARALRLLAAPLSLALRDLDARAP